MRQNLDKPFFFIVLLLFALCISLVACSPSTPIPASPTPPPPTSTPTSPPTSTPTLPPPTPTAPPPTSTPTIPPQTLTLIASDPVKAFEISYNQHDLQALMTILSEDATLEWSIMGFYYVSSQAILKSHELSFGMKASINLTNCSSDSSKVTCNYESSDDCFEAAGVSPYHQDITFSLKNNHIRKIILDNDLEEDYQAYKKFWNNYLWFLQQNYPTEFNQLDHGITSYDLGTKLAERCKEFASSLQ